MLRDASEIFRQILLEKQYVNWKQIAECEEMQHEQEQPAPLGLLLCRKGYLSEEQFQELLGVQRQRLERRHPRARQQLEDRLFGRLAVERGFLSAGELEQVQSELDQASAAGKRPRLEEWLVEKDFLRPDQVDEIREERRRSILLCEVCLAQFQTGSLEPGKRFRCPNCGSRIEWERSERREAFLRAAPGTPSEPAGDARPVGGTTAEPGGAKGEGELASLADLQELARPVRLGRYELLQQIGAGGMGMVYKSRDTELGRTVAVKVLRRLSGGRADDVVKRFQREAKAMAKVCHPHVVQVYDIGQEGENAYFAMEYIEGMTLDEWKLLPDFRLRDGIRLLAEVACGVEAAHRAGVIHRDLKPGNVIVDTEGHAHVTDFGLAQDRDAKSRLTLSGQLLGTVMYLSPEQALGRRSVTDARSDVFSLGAVLYEMLVGRPPFFGDTVVAVLQKILHEEAEFPPQRHRRIPEDLQSVCLKALEKDPARRYASAQALAEDLQRTLRREATLAKPSSGMRRLWKRLRSTAPRWAAALIAGLLLALVAVGLVLRERGRQKDFQKAVAQARQALEEGREQEALVSIRVGLKLLPDNPEAREIRARIEEALRRKEEKFQSEKAQLKVAVREAEGKLQEREQALPLFERGKRIVEDLRQQIARKRLEGSRERVQESIRVLGEAIGKAPEFAEPYFWRGEVKWLLEEHAGALEDYEKAIGLGMRHPGPYLGRALCYLVELAHLSPLTLKVMQHDDLATGSRLEVTQPSQKNREKVAELAEKIRRDAVKVMEIGTAPEHVAFLHGVLAALDRQHDQAIKEFTRAIEEYRSYAEAYRERAFQWAIIGKHDQALADIVEALSYHPEQQLSWRFRTMVELLQENYPEAAESATRAVELEPQNGELHYLRGSVLYWWGKRREAIGDFTRGLELGFGQGTVYGARGQAYLEMGELEKALGDFDQAIARDPREAHLYVLRGNLWSHHKGDPGRAVADFDRAIELDPNDANAIATRGVARWKLGDLPRALEDFTRAIELAPRLGRAYAWRAIVHNGLGDLVEAQKDAERALELKGDDKSNFSFVHRARAVVFSALGRWEKVERELDEVLRDFPDHVESLANRGLARANQGDREGALENFNRALSLDPKYVEGYFKRAQFYFARAEFGNAAKDFQRALELLPQGAEAEEARRMLEECRKKSSDTSD